VPRVTRLPWIPGEQQWLGILEAARGEPVRNRVMLGLALVPYGPRWHKLEVPSLQRNSGQRPLGAIHNLWCSAYSVRNQEVS